MNINLETRYLHKLRKSSEKINYSTFCISNIAHALNMYKIYVRYVCAYPQLQSILHVFVPQIK